MVLASSGLNRLDSGHFDATPKDDLELIRQRVAEREKMRAAADVS
jgi:hypothetical protein